METLFAVFLFVLQVLLIQASTTDQPISEFQNVDSLQEKYGKIKHAAILFRHGDRTSLSQYPNDPYRNYTWPVGPGQLLNAGKMKHLENGRWFKKRYMNLTGQTYNYKLIKVQSSDVDRTIMSAFCFLFGYFPATGSDIWYDDEKWQPIPVHTIPSEYDNIIQTTQECPRLQQIIIDALESEQVKEILEKYNQTLTYIENHSGLIFTNVSPAEAFNNIANIYDILTVEAAHNLTLPTWTEKVFPQPIETIMLELAGSANDTEKKRLSAGPFLASITSDMVQKSTMENFSQTFHIYSGHDTTIYYIMGALDILNDIWPPYAATLMFELRENNSEHFVTISYKNTTNTSYLISMKGCETVCTLEEFLDITKPLIPDDWASECKKESVTSVGKTFMKFKNFAFLGFLFSNSASVTVTNYSLILLSFVIYKWIHE